MNKKREILRLSEVAIEIKSIFFLVPALLFFSGCATTPYYPPPAAAPPAMPGVYHRVSRGETLWRIARAYNIEMEELVRLNRISDASVIETDQLIFIPNRQKQLSLSSVYAGDDFIWPLKGKVIHSFGEACGSMINKGINIDPAGAGQVLAVRNGRVVFYSGNFGSFGKTIIIDHGDGVCTVYARNKEVFIKPGDRVIQGALIASVGSAGRDKEEYLHFEVRQGHIPKNPLFYLPR
ncbi:MAG: peptidoglycan DD-metalloendopeptidase family protein [Candidatus Omnitrophota bacterium]|nr:peptidoglycan DD-metalloendopeptidase family protein [Candidatus Omnitrophota bacterium]